VGSDGVGLATECPPAAQRSGRLWKAGAGSEVSGRGVSLRQRHQAGALQALREFGGAVGSGGSGWTASACRGCVCRARLESGHARVTALAADRIGAARSCNWKEGFPPADDSGFGESPIRGVPGSVGPGPPAECYRHGCPKGARFWSWGTVATPLRNLVLRRLLPVVWRTSWRRPGPGRTAQARDSTGGLV